MTTEVGSSVDEDPMAGDASAGQDIDQIRVWIVAPDATGEVSLTSWCVGATPAEVGLGYHYELARRLAADEGYGDPMVAFDENDPAGKSILNLGSRADEQNQKEVPGEQEDPEWQVPLAVMATLSARVRVRAQSRDQALELAREFVRGEGAQLMSLDEGNYRGPSDYYVYDEQELVRT